MSNFQVGDIVRSRFAINDTHLYSLITEKHIQYNRIIDFNLKYGHDSIKEYNIDNYNLYTNIFTE